MPRKPAIITWAKSWHTPARPAKASATGRADGGRLGVEAEILRDPPHQVVRRAVGGAAGGEARACVVGHLAQEGHPVAR